MANAVQERAERRTVGSVSLRTSSWQWLVERAQDAGTSVSAYLDGILAQKRGKDGER